MDDDAPALPHEQDLADAENTAADLAEQSERLEGEIADAREDWEAKKADSGVPGAPPDPEAEEGDDDDARAAVLRGDDAAVSGGAETE